MFILVCVSPFSYVNFLWQAFWTHLRGSSSNHSHKQKPKTSAQSVPLPYFCLSITKSISFINNYISVRGGFHPAPYMIRESPVHCPLIPQEDNVPAKVQGPYHAQKTVYTELTLSALKLQFQKILKLYI